MPTMLEDRGADYVTAWPTGIADRINTPTWVVLRAIRTITGENVEDGTSGLAVNDRLVAVLGAVDGPTAKRIIAEAQRAHADYKQSTRNNCHYCGLPMRNGRCEECV